MLMVYPHPEFQFTHVLPYGALACSSSCSVAAPRRCGSCLYDDANDREPSEVIDFDHDSDRWGDIWSVFVPGVRAGQLYHFQADGPYDPDAGMLFDGQARLIDPYAKALAGTFQKSRRRHFAPAEVRGG
jgi:isoamylase